MMLAHLLTLAPQRVIARIATAYRVKRMRCPKCQNERVGTRGTVSLSIWRIKIY